MKYCIHCGNQLVDEAVICPKCGCAAESKTGNGFQNTNTSPLSTMAIVGFIFAFLEPLIGLICSILAYRSAEQAGDERSKNFAKIGTIISSVLLGVAILAIILVFILFAMGIFVIGGAISPYY